MCRLITANNPNTLPLFSMMTWWRVWLWLRFSFFRVPLDHHTHILLVLWCIIKPLFWTELKALPAVLADLCFGSCLLVRGSSYDIYCCSSWMFLRYLVTQSDWLRRMYIE